MSVSLFKVWAPRKWWNQDLSPSQRLKSFLFSCYAGLSQSANPVTVLKTSALRKTAPSELGPLTLSTMNSSLNICIAAKPPRWESQVIYLSARKHIYPLINIGEERIFWYLEPVFLISSKMPWTWVGIFNWVSFIFIFSYNTPQYSL